MGLEGRSAVVTGGGRGIGAEAARALAAAGARVAVSARTQKEIDAVAAELVAAGHEAVAVPCDVTDPEAVRALREAAEKALGPIDILVNNAGAASSARFVQTTLEEWNRLLAINATGTFLCTREVLPGMIERGWGRVVNVASVAGRTAMPYISAYAASKHAVIGLTRAVAAEVAARGVTVNAICPGYVDTPMTDASIVRIVEKTRLSAAEARTNLERMSPQGRLMEPREIAWLTVALCDPLAGGINGQAIVLDGGMLLA